MYPKIRRLLALAVIAPLAIGACGPDEDEADDLDIGEPATEAPAPTTSPAPTSVRLDPIGASGVEGEVSSMTRGEDVELTLALTGLTAEGDYEATIEPGSCPMTGSADMDATDEMEGGDEMAGGDEMDEEIGEIDLQVSANGATGSTTVSASDLGGGAHVAIRDDAGTLVACGDLGQGGATLERPAPPTGGGTDEGGTDGN